MYRKVEQMFRNGMNINRNFYNPFSRIADKILSVW
uniref:Uncharacterized protein n=1 Tax=Arundo donax TaxID=35708 RepID=A0A0A9G0Y8_ARUDO